MTYKKKRGVLSCVVVNCTPFWIDVVNAKSGAEACVFFKYKLSDKLKASLGELIKQGRRTHIVVEKLPEDQHYKFICFSGGGAIGQKRKMERIMAYEALQREVSADYNPVRSRSNKQSLVVGRAGLPTSERTGNRISRSLSNRVDNSKEWEEQKQKAEAAKKEKQKKARLLKLRKKHFFKRNFFVGAEATDAEWDNYLLSGKIEEFESTGEGTKELQAELKEAGLL